MQLTPDDIERYAPDHTLREFKEGYEAYPSLHCPYDRNSVSAQAWERGLECAMRHAMRRAMRHNNRS